METPREADQTPEQQLSSGINNPDIDPKTLAIGRKSISNEQQAWSIFENLKQAQDTRNGVNAQIIDNCNGKPPYSPGDIAPWQSNFSALFLSGIIDKIVPVLVGYVENAKYLTQSKLKDESTAGADKSEKMRDLFTRTVRRWPGWRSFISSLCQELILIGYTFAIRTDEYDWRVKHYRQDQAFVPEGTPQFAEFVQVLGVEQDVLIHELVEIIQDQDTARAAKWNVLNTVESINKSMPKREGDDNQQSNPRTWVDIVQEGSLGMAHSNGAQTVKLAHLFAIETGDDGRVTHVVVDRDGGHKELLWNESQFESMRDVVTLFTLDPGNGNFYGSRGVGRRAANYSIALDHVINDLVDQLRLAGLIVLEQDLAKGTPPPRIKRPFLWLNKDSALVQQRQGMNLNLEAGVTLINKLGEMAQIATQQYVPNTIAESTANNSDKPTAHQVQIDYQREQQSIAASIGRFAGQVAEMVGMMQRAMFNPDTNDKEAMEARRIALKGDKGKNIPPILDSEDELKEWAYSPAAEVLQDLTVMESQAKLMATNDPEIMQSPAIDQKKRIEMKLGAMLPQPLAESLLKADFMDPNDEAEQYGLQQMESDSILQGNSVPVSGRHNHKVHLDVLIPDMMKGGMGVQQQINQNPRAAADPKVGEILDHFGAGIKHAEAHVQKWAEQKPQPSAIEPYVKAVQGARQAHEQLIQELLKLKTQVHQADAKQQQEQAAAATPEGGGEGGGDGGGGASAAQPMPGPGDVPIPFTEKIATAWIGQFDKLQDNEQRRLETLTGLSTPAIAAEDAISKQANATPVAPASTGPATLPPPSDQDGDEPSAPEPTQ